MTKNSAELLLINQATLRAFGEATANGPTATAVELAYKNIQDADSLLDQILIEHDIAQREERTRERARELARIEPI